MEETLLDPRNFFSKMKLTYHMIFLKKPTKAEIIAAINARKDNKATGHDIKPIEIIKSHTKLSDNIFLKFLN